MEGKVPAFDLLADECPAIAVVRMQVDEVQFFLFGPFVFVDAAPEVVVVSFAALFAVAGRDVVLFLHDAGDFAPLADLSNFKQFFQNMVVLCQGIGYLLLPDLPFAHLGKNRYLLYHNSAPD